MNLETVLCESDLFGDMGMSSIWRGWQHRIIAARPGQCLVCTVCLLPDVACVRGA